MSGQSQVSMGAGQRAALWLGSRGLFTAVLFAIPAGWASGYLVHWAGGSDETAQVGATVGAVAFGIVYVGCRLWAGRQLVTGRAAPGSAPWRPPGEDMARLPAAPELVADCELVPIFPGSPQGTGRVYATEPALYVFVPGHRIELQWRHVKHFEPVVDDGDGVEFVFHMMPAGGGYLVGVKPQGGVDAWVSLFERRDVRRRVDGG